MGTTIKRNVAEFNKDVAEFGGYQYSKSNRYSSIVSNRRITDAVDAVIREIDRVNSVLDAGCGDGTYTAELKQRFPDVSFTGFDPAEKAIEEASQRYGTCRFTTGDILNAKTFPAGPFDLVIIRGVLHHLPTQQSAIANAATVSNRVLIIEPNGNNPILKWIEKNSTYHIEHEEQSFSSDHLLQLCRESDLVVKKLAFIGFVPFFFPTIPAKIIHYFQPFLERVPGLAKHFGGQIVILAERQSRLMSRYRTSAIVAEPKTAGRST